MVWKPLPMTEEEIALASSYFFSAQGWDLYPEVVVPIFGGRPDHIGVKESGLTSVFEYKKSLTYPVLEQLTRWHHEKERASTCSYQDESKKAIPHLLIAVSQRGKNGGKFPALKKEILDSYRIGYYEIEKQDGDRSWRMSTKDLKDGEIFDGNHLHIGKFKYTLHEVIAPKIQAGSRQSAHNIIPHLREDMKMGRSGTTGLKDAYMTDFKRTMNKVRKVLEKGGEWHVDHIIRVINEEMGGHHYCSDLSAKGQICKFIEELGIGHKIYDYNPTYSIKKPKPNCQNSKKRIKQT